MLFHNLPIYIYYKIVIQIKKFPHYIKTAEMKGANEYQSRMDLIFSTKFDTQ